MMYSPSIVPDAFLQELDIVADFLLCKNTTDFVRLGEALKKRDLSEFCDQTLWSNFKDLCAPLPEGIRLWSICSFANVNGSCKNRVIEGTDYCKRHSSIAAPVVDLEAPTLPVAEPAPVPQPKPETKAPKPCTRLTTKNLPCKNNAVPGTDVCKRHSTSSEGKATVATAASERPICVEKTSKGLRCKLRAVAGSDRCKRHGGVTTAAAVAATVADVFAPEVVFCSLHDMKGSPCKNRPLKGRTTCKKHSNGGPAPATDVVPTARVPQPMCASQTKKHEPCKNRAIVGSKFCKRHSDGTNQIVADFTKKYESKKQRLNGPLCEAINGATGKQCQNAPLGETEFCGTHAFKKPTIVSTDAFETIKKPDIPQSEEGWYFKGEVVSSARNWVRMEVDLSEHVMIDEQEIYPIDDNYHLAIYEYKGIVKAYVRSMHDCEFPIRALLEGFRKLHDILGTEPSTQVNLFVVPAKLNLRASETDGEE